MSEYAVMPIEDYKNTCDKVREKTGAEEAIKSGELAGEVEKVFEVGKDEALKEVWRERTKNYTRTNYENFCIEATLTNKTFKPDKTIKPRIATRMFWHTQAGNKENFIDLVEYEKETGVTIDFSDCVSVKQAFVQETVFSTMNVFDISKCGTDTSITNPTYQCFVGGGSYGITRIEKLIVSEDTPFYITFQSAVYMNHCIVDGVIAKNGFDWNNVGTKVDGADYESLISVIDCLKDYSEDTSGTVWKVTFGTINLNKLTAEDKARIEAKGWTYA